MILDANHSTEIKEQALCILANIGDGDTAKDFIMNNEDILKKLKEYMVILFENWNNSTTMWGSFKKQP